MRAIIALALLISPTIAHAAIGDRVSLKGASIGCANLDDLGHIKDLLVLQHDKVAAMRAALAASCPLKSSGTPATIEDSSFMRNAVCLHFEGEPTCLWMPRAAIEE